MRDENDVDVIVRQDQPADARLLLDARRDGAHARGQDRSEHAAFAGVDQLQRRDRLACQHRGARDRFSSGLSNSLRARGGVSLNVARVHRVLRPIHPAEALGPTIWPRPILPRHQHLRGVGRDSSLTTLVGLLMRLITPKKAPRPHTPAMATPSSCARFIARSSLSAEIANRCAAGRHCSTIVNGWLIAGANRHAAGD